MNLEKQWIAQLISATSLSVIAVTPAHSLPGEDVRTVIQRYNKHPLFRGVAFETYETDSFNEVGQVATFKNHSTMSSNYRPAIIYDKYSAFNFGFRVGRGNRVDSEGFRMDSTTIGLIALQTRADLRKDAAIAKLMTNIWGQAVGADFISSRFTAAFATGRGTRRVYEGKNFVYESRAAAGFPEGVSLTIHIFPPSYGSFLRNSMEYEQRL